MIRIRSMMLTGTAIALFSFGAEAQDEEPTMRAIPDPAADLPDAVTKEILLPEQANDEAIARSAAGRSGERRDAGLATAQEAGANGLLQASEAADNSRAEFGRSHIPESLPSQVPDLSDQVPVDPPGPPDITPPDVPSPPVG